MLMILNPVIECQGKSVFCCICKSAGEGVFQKNTPSPLFLEAVPVSHRC